MQSTYTGQPWKRGDMEASASLCYGEDGELYENLGRGSKPLMVRGDGTCVGHGDQVFFLWNPLCLAVGSFRRSDDATHVEGTFQTQSEEGGSQASYLHRMAGNGFRPHREDWAPQAHRVFVYMLFFDSLLRDDDGKVVGGVCNGAPFLFTHDLRTR